MKNCFLSLVLFWPFRFALGNDPKEILIAAYQQCQSMQFGYYEATSFKKYLFAKDTIRQYSTCFFIRQKDDSLTGSYFHMTEMPEGKTRQIIYNGREYIRATPEDSLAVTYNVSSWEDEVRKLISQTDLFLPFTSATSYPVPEHFEEDIFRQSLEWIADELVSGMPTHHIRLIQRLKDKGGNDFRVIANEYHYWIKTDDFVPVQYSIELLAIAGNDTLRQSEKYCITKFETKESLRNQVISSDLLPAYYRLTPFDPEEMKK